jgi:hypothetical protein
MSLDKTTEKPTTIGPNHNWTPRWVELRPHAVQLGLWQSNARFKIVPSGRRSGKTEFAKRRLAEHLVRRTPDRQPGRYFAAAPTRDQARRIFWDDLKALVPANWVETIRETDLQISMRNGAQVWVQGLDVPQRIEGSPWDGCVIDELANCKPGIWDSHIRPALADRRGWAWLIGVPDMHSPAQVEYENLVFLARSGTDPEWECFRWPSSDILPVEEIESARRRLDPKIFQQEYLGEFVVARGRAFGDFDAAQHVRNIEYDPNLPICWSLDFNIDPMCSGVIQHFHDQVRIIDEFVLPDTDTNSACDAFLERAIERKWYLRDMRIYGDATGNARDSTSGITDWHIVFNRLGTYSPRRHVPRSNPALKDSINALRARLKTTDGKSNLLIDPNCRQLISDLRSAIWPGNLDSHHALAWLRYFVNAEYPVELERDEVKGTVGFST